MSLKRKEPADIARRLGERHARPPDARARSGQSSAWKRETYTLSRQMAREKAREWFGKFPKAAYMTEIEFWRELGDGRIEFTIRRLPSAD